jgi:hypothetical protein
MHSSEVFSLFVGMMLEERGEKSVVKRKRLEGCGEKVAVKRTML